MVKSCVNRFGADLSVPSITQCSASDMEVFVGVPPPGSEEGAFPVSCVVFSSVEDKAVAVEDGVQGSSVASRNKLKVSCHSSRRVVVNAMVSR